MYFPAIIAQIDISIENQIDSLFEEYSYHNPGVAVAVVQEGKMLFKKGYGMANLEYDVPITTTTAFNIGSVSKQFTAFAAYLLEEEGRISLDDDVRKYIPELRDYGKTIKLKHLLAHTSGLKDQWALLALSGWRMDGVITNNQIFQLVTSQNELNFDPGTQFSYSNTGYTLAAMIIERVTGRKFAEYLNENIFQPLGMINSQVYDNYEKLIKNRAYSYEKSGDTFVKRKLNCSSSGATSLFTTVEDLAKWVSNLHNPIVGNPELIKRFNEVSYLNDKTPAVWAETPQRTLYYAKGQLSYDYKGLKILSHGGHDGGFRAVLSRFPEYKFTVITLSNNEHYTMIHKTFPLVEMYLKDFLASKPKGKVSSANVEPNREEFTNLLGLYEGVYSSEELGTSYKIKFNSGVLTMSHKRLDDIQLREIGKNRVSGMHGDFLFELEFTFENQNVSGFRISNFGAKNVKFKKTQ